MGIPCQRLVNDKPVNSQLSPTRYRFLIPLDTRLVHERLLLFFSHRHVRSRTCIASRRIYGFVLPDLGLIGSGVLVCFTIQAFTGRVPVWIFLDHLQGTITHYDFNIHVQLNLSSFFLGLRMVNEYGLILYLPREFPTVSS